MPGLGVRASSHMHEIGGRAVEEVSRSRGHIPVRRAIRRGYRVQSPKHMGSGNAACWREASDSRRGSGFPDAAPRYFSGKKSGLRSLILRRRITSNIQLAVRLINYSDGRTEAASDVLSAMSLVSEEYPDAVFYQQDGSDVSLLTTDCVLAWANSYAAFTSNRTEIVAEICVAGGGADNRPRLTQRYKSCK